MQLSPEKGDVFRYELGLEESKIKTAACCAPRSRDSGLAESKEGREGRDRAGRATPSDL